MATSWSSTSTFKATSTKNHGGYSATLECECGWQWRNNSDNTSLQYAIYSRARYSSSNATGYGVETHAYMTQISPNDNTATGVLNYGNWVADTGWCYSNWIPRTHVSQNVEIWALAQGKLVSGYGAAPENTGWFKFVDTMGPLESWSVSYNANGGTGAPSAQTKWKGETLTLSSSTPSKEGYTFNGWNTASNGSGTNYAAGASYTANAAATLYAKWTANTYAVTFDANGGSGGPSTQTKTYGQSLTISSTKPTRTNYKFLGWATSASATSAQYRTGTNNDQNTSYTTNAAVTLYAVWELTYTPPKITNLNCFRCDASGNAADDGERCYVSFTYTTDTTISATNYATVTAKVGSNSATTLVASSAHKTGTNTYSGVLSDTGLSVNSTYSVAITVSDVQGSSTTSTTILSQAFFTIDVLSGGHGVAIGKPATDVGLLDVGMDAKFGGDVTFTASKTANTVLAAPNGSAGAPSFRTLVAADLPAVNNLTDFGTYVYSAQLSRTKNTFLAAPATANGIASFRTIAAADLTMTAWTYLAGSATASFYVRWCKVANIVHVEVFGSKSLSSNTNTKLASSAIASGSRPAKEVDNNLYSSVNHVGVLWVDTSGYVWGKNTGTAVTVCYGFLSYPVI